MKFTMNRSRFMKYLADVSGAVATRTTIPILTGIKIDVQSDGILLTGSDTDVSIEVFIPSSDDDNQLKIEAQGGIILQGNLFNGIVKNFSSNEITIEVLDHFQTLIQSGQAQYTINGQDVNNYPRLPEIDTDDVYLLDTKLFTQVINHTIKSVATSESRPILKGIHFIIEEGTLLAVATDSHRLSQRVVPLQMSTDLMSKKHDIVIPGTSLKTLIRILEAHDQIEMMITDNQVLFKAENVYFYTRLLEGNYPATERLIPTESTTIVTLNASEFSQALNRASLLSHAGKNNVVKLSINDARILLSSNSPEIGYVEEEVNYEKASGDAIEISFNPDYVRDALATFGQTDVTLNFTAPIRPFIILPVEQENNLINNAFVQLITPIRAFDN